MMIPAATCALQSTVVEPSLYLAFELGQTRWKLGFTTGLGQRPRERTLPARDLGRVVEEIDRAKARFGLGPAAPVVSCDEAGRDGFWLHRFLVAQGVASHVVDSASIEVNRRRRRAKSDRLDVGKLRYQLVRYRAGERKVWSVVQVPTDAAEDGRQAHRELLTLKRDRGRVTNRIKGLLANQGVVLELGADFPEVVAPVRRWDGSPLPPGLRARREREWAKVELVTEQIHGLEAARREALRTATDPVVEQVRQAAPAAGDRGEPRLALRAGILRVARVPKPAGGGRAGGVDADAVPERGAEPGAGDRQGGEPLHPGDGDRDRVGLVAVSTGERAEPVG